MIDYTIKSRPKIPRNKYGYLTSSSTGGGGVRTVINNSSGGGNSWDYVYPEQITSSSDGVRLKQKEIQVYGVDGDQFDNITVIKKDGIKISEDSNTNSIELALTNTSAKVELVNVDSECTNTITDEGIKVVDANLGKQFELKAGSFKHTGLPFTSGTDVVHLLGSKPDGTIKKVDGAVTFDNFNRTLKIGANGNNVKLELYGDLGLNGDLLSDKGFNFGESTDVSFKKKPYFTDGTNTYVMLDKSDISNKVVDGLINETNVTPNKQKLYPADNNENVVPSNKTVYDYVEGKVDHWGMNTRTTPLQINDDDIHIPTTRWVMNYCNGGISPVTTTSKDLTELIKHIDFSVAGATVITCNYTLNIGVSDWRELAKYKLYAFINDNDSQPVDIKLIADSYDDEKMNIMFQYMGRTATSQTESGYLCTFMGRVSLNNNVLKLSSYNRRLLGSAASTYTNLV